MAQNWAKSDSFIYPIISNFVIQQSKCVILMQAPNVHRFDQLIEYGQKMLASIPRMKQVKDRLTALKQEKTALRDTWCERNDILHESQDLQVSCQNYIQSKLSLQKPP